MSGGQNFKTLRLECLGYGSLPISAASVVPVPRYPRPDMAAKVRTGAAGERELRDSVMGASPWVLGRV